MLIDPPVIMPPGVPINRPPSNERMGGGTTAVPAESPRPLDDPEEGDASRRNEEQANSEEKPGRDDAELLVARTRVDAARERADESHPSQAIPREISTPAEDEDTLLSRREIEILRERLEARLAGNPAGTTLRSVDENI